MNVADTQTASEPNASPPGSLGPERPDPILARLKAFEGRPTGEPFRGPDPVNQPMIRHWVEALGDDNPVYVDAEIARRNGLPGVVAPPAMLQAWVMRGYRASIESDAARKANAESASSGSDDAPPELSAQDELFGILDSAGFTSVVATNCEQHYERPLVVGDHLTVKSTIESVSTRKATALGEGYFVTTRSDFEDEAGELVAAMRFRILRFKPRSDASRASKADQAPNAEAAGAVDGGRSTQSRPRRPRPALTRDNSFFFEGAKRGKLLIQRCSSCARLRHPPRPGCGDCGSFDWETAEADGHGTVYSFVVVHHPHVPGFEYPLPIALVELDEGTRLVADLTEVDPSEVRIGMELECVFVDLDDEMTLPMFRPARGTP